MNRPNLIDELIRISITVTDPEKLSVLLRGFMSNDLPNQLIEILETLLLRSNTAVEFRENSNLQNLLILTAIKVKSTSIKLLLYVNTFNDYSASDLAPIALQSDFPEVALVLYKKANLHSEVVNVLISHLHDLPAAQEYAKEINDPKIAERVKQAMQK
jgi:clathrin heavy chain